MDAAQQPPALRLGVVLRPEADRCLVGLVTGPAVVTYGAPFRRRAETLTPGHLLAVTDGVDGPSLVLWRWYDAVVLEQSEDGVRIWEPAHGEVLAQARRPGQRWPMGTRAYASAGLPGADWWVEGPVTAVERAEVALDEVDAFYAGHDLWGRLA